MYNVEEMLAEKEVLEALKSFFIEINDKIFFKFYIFLMFILLLISIFNIAICIVNGFKNNFDKKFMKRIYFVLYFYLFRTFSNFLINVYFTFKLINQVKEKILSPDNFKIWSILTLKEDRWVLIRKKLYDFYLNEKIGNSDILLYAYSTFWFALTLLLFILIIRIILELICSNQSTKIIFIPLTLLIFMPFRFLLIKFEFFNMILFFNLVCVPFIFFFLIYLHLKKNLRKNQLIDKVIQNTNPSVQDIEENIPEYP